ncbi:MAG: DUF3298 and DUF4163 domain-containing protein [Treponema sp.]|nr:DUF3298 and DUF4163 domain-containing protein [Treponema sp.]
MKTKLCKQTIQMFLLCFLALLPAACKSTGTAASGGNAGSRPRTRDFVLVSKEQTFFLYPDEQDTSSKLYISFTLLDITGAEKQFMSPVLYKGQSPGEYADKKFQDYDKMYGEMRGVVEKMPNMSWESLNWFYNETFAVVTETPRIAIISQEKDYYTGGAHGMRSKDYYVFSLEEKRQLTLDDIVMDEAKPALEDLVEEALRGLMEIPSWIPLSEKGFFEDWEGKLEDFYLSSHGLGFQWDPYEIAPYVMGSMEISIPYNRLQGILTQRGFTLAKEIR